MRLRLVARLSIALATGAAVAIATFIAGVATVSAMSCPRCNGPGPCSLLACVMDYTGHVQAALLIGLMAALLVYLGLRMLANRMNRSLAANGAPTLTGSGSP